MKTRQLNAELPWYILAFLLALAMRLFQLGAAPLNDVEAGWALQALALAHGSSSALGAQPAYLILTSQLFAIFGDTNFLARLFPALAGSLLVWLPFCLRRWMGRSTWLQRAGLVLAFGLAIDPALVSLSRQVGSPVPALAFTLLALASLSNRRMVWLGIFSGLALLSGPAFMQGLLIAGICYAIFRLVYRQIPQTQPGDDPLSTPAEAITTRSIGVALSAFGGTLLIVAVLFLRIPQGLGALGETLPAYLDAWVRPSGVPILRIPASLLVYQPFVLIFAITAAVRGLTSYRDNLQLRWVLQCLGISALVAILVPLLYNGRQVADMAWALVPLWTLASLEISRSLNNEEDKLTNLVAGGLGLLLFVLIVVGWINLLSIGRYQVGVTVYWAIILGALLIAVIAVLLVAATWSTVAARLGVVWVLTLVMVLQLISSAWGMAVVRQNGAQDLWISPSSAGQADLLTKTLSDLSSWTTGLRNQVEIITLEDPSRAGWNALKWALRSFPNSRFVTALSPTDSPPIVITVKEAEIPSLAQNYRGQDFVWRRYPGWQGVFPPNFINWLAFRQAKLGEDQIILWARTDIFPGAETGASGSTVP